MAEVTLLPAEELREILESVSVLNLTTKEWELALEPNPLFEKRNADLVQRQDMLWKSKEEQFAEMEDVKPTTATAASLSKRTRKRSIREAHN